MHFSTKQRLYHLPKCYFQTGKKFQPDTASQDSAERLGSSRGCGFGFEHSIVLYPDISIFELIQTHLFSPYTITTKPVMATLITARGIKTFQQSHINWSGRI
jgi:hypothetical protein